MREAFGRPARQIEEAADSATFVFIGVSTAVRDRPRHDLAAPDGGRGAPSEEIDVTDHSSKGGAQLLGVHAGAGARGHNGD
jgi:hypothetical protein